MTFIFIALIALLAIVPQLMIRKAVHNGSSMRNARAMNGRETAERILMANNINDVSIERIAGELTDHYDPRSKTIRLSELVYDQPTITAQAIAAHEVGHAIQHNRNYLPLRFRSGLAPLAIGASQVWIIILIIGATLGAMGLIWLALAMYSTAILFQLVTLPVEFDASRRAGRELDRLGLATDGEGAMRRSVLRAAAMTYVAAALASILTLLYYLSIYARR